MRNSMFHCEWFDEEYSGISGDAGNEESLCISFVTSARHLVGDHRGAR